jgi:hypothetical protein
VSALTTGCDVGHAKLGFSQRDVSQITGSSPIFGVSWGPCLMRMIAVLVTVGEGAAVRTEGRLPISVPPDFERLFEMLLREKQDAKR